mmetsp:Transcript_146846/g.273468  ORF Transcript_146846/g.273468 Transcript_146846/m.273468 type:complete len:203 (+) Transcript_146846:893-1501(+)
MPKASDLRHEYYLQNYFARPPFQQYAQLRLPFQQQARVPLVSQRQAQVPQPSQQQYQLPLAQGTQEVHDQPLPVPLPAPAMPVDHDQPPPPQLVSVELQLIGPQRCHPDRLPSRLRLLSVEKLRLLAWQRTSCARQSRFSCRWGKLPLPLPPQHPPLLQSSSQGCEADLCRGTAGGASCQSARHLCRTCSSYLSFSPIAPAS